jgi:HK97 family phage portal protein
VYNQLDDDLKYLVTSNKNVKRTVSPEDILHFYMWSRDGVNGVSLLNYGQRVVDLANAAEQTAKQFFDSGCQITGVLSFDGRVTDSQKDKIRAAWNAIHAGDNASGLAILEGSSKFEKIAANSQEAQLLETRNYNTTEIARLFNISPILLGDLSHTSYADIEQAQLEFVTHTLLPYIIMFETEIDRKLLKSEGTRFFDIDETSQLKGTKNALATYLSTLVSNGIMTVNEARRILELNPIDGGDELIIPYTKIQDNTINGNEDIKTDSDDSTDGGTTSDIDELQDGTAE